MQELGKKRVRAAFRSKLSFRPNSVTFGRGGIGAIAAAALKTLRRPRNAVGVTILTGTVAIGVIVAVSGGRSARYDPPLYVAIETTAALAGLLAAYLLFFRFRRSARLDDLLLAVGLGILSVCNLVYGALPAALEESPNRADTWGLASGHLLGAFVLALAAFCPKHVLARPRRAAWLLVGYSAVALAMLAEALTALARWLPIDVGTPRSHDAALVVQLTLTALIGAAALAFFHRAERDGDGFMTWLAVAATLRVFAGVDYAFRPTLESGWVYTGDIFRMLFYFALIAGAAGEIGRYGRASRDAAILDERRRIARELHDGLAQELTFIAHRAARTLEREPYSKLATQIASAAERALDESRRVIATLTRPLDEPLEVVLSDAVKGVADRVGTTVALAIDPGVRVSPDVREALVRIAREAVANAARHGDAQLVTVELENGSGVRLRIVDDGRGFDADEARRKPNGRFGLISMTERAQAIGGVLRVDSRRGAGTTVEVELP
jgi:signal transduction histidine kinase